MLKKVFHYSPFSCRTWSSFRRRKSTLISQHRSIRLVWFDLHLFFASFWRRPAPFLIEVVAFGVGSKVAEWFPVPKALLSPKSRGFGGADVGFDGIEHWAGIARGGAHRPGRHPLFRPGWWQSSEGVPVRIAGHFGVGTAVRLSLFWQVWLLLSKHPPLDVGEYYEAGITSLLFYMVGVLVWLERADLRRRRSSPQVICWNWVVRGNSCCSKSGWPRSDAFRVRSRSRLEIQWRGSRVR